MSDKIWFDPTSDKWALSDGEHYLEVPHWAREIIVNEFERVTRQLKAENAKLRKLCATVIDDWMSKVCPSFPFCEYGGEYQDCADETCGNQIYRQMARELGVDE